MGAKFHPVLGNAAQRAQAECLEAAAIGQNGFVPGVEGVQAAASGHQFVAGTQIQMIGVAQNDLSADSLQIVGGYGFDAAHRAHGHEDGGSDGAVGGVQYARAGRAVRAVEFKGAGSGVHTSSFAGAVRF